MGEATGTFQDSLVVNTVGRYFVQPLTSLIPFSNHPPPYQPTTRIPQDPLKAPIVSVPTPIPPEHNEARAVEQVLSAATAATFISGNPIFRKLSRSTTIRELVFRIDASGDRLTNAALGVAVD